MISKKSLQKKPPPKLDKQKPIFDEDKKPSQEEIDAYIESIPW